MNEKFSNVAQGKLALFKAVQLCLLITKCAEITIFGDSIVGLSEFSNFVG